MDDFNDFDNDELYFSDDDEIPKENILEDDDIPDFIVDNEDDFDGQVECEFGQ